MLEYLINFINDLFINPESKYFFLIFALFILPKFFARFGVPQALISFIFGMICSQCLNLFEHDPTIKILASLGIISLFLFAGLEIEFSVLNKYKKILIGHVLFRVLTCTTVCLISAYVFDIDYRAAAIRGRLVHESKGVSLVF